MDLWLKTGSCRKSSDSVPEKDITLGDDSNVPGQSCSNNEKTTSQYTRILLAIIDVILCLGQRNIALRGNWDKAPKREDGNFQFFVDWRSQFDHVLRDHLKSTGPRYLSPKVQNEIIRCCETEIREKIVNDCNNSGLFAICCDETPDVSTKEQMSICVRFFEDSYIREEFIGYVELTKTDAETISQSILSCTKLRGQGYDGASVMSGHVSGVQSRRRECPQKQFNYVHCRSHDLSLVVTHSCKTVHAIRNIIDNVVQLTWFVCASANRKNILKEAMVNDSDLLQQIIEVTEEYDFRGKLLQNAGNKQSLQPRSETQWTARVDSLSVIISNYSNLHNALITIEENSSGESKVKAGGHGRLLEDPEFIMGITVAQYVLSYLKPLTLSLQKTDCDMVIAFDEAHYTLTTLRTLRTDEKCSKVFQRAQILADSIEVLLQPRRRTGRQVHRDNPNVNTAEQLWRATIYYAFLDHVCSRKDIFLSTNMSRRIASPACVLFTVNTHA